MIGPFFFFHMLDELTYSLCRLWFLLLVTYVTHSLGTTMSPVELVVNIITMLEMRWNICFWTKQMSHS